ncbi:MAG: hypothetical protein HXS51_06980 [Theionarchaea archaeon]|nr:hypothetical protein [Theionarchaea archaeon]MBU7000488.1 hypothetical protein [Theionarchaea archaeon]
MASLVSDFVESCGGGCVEKKVTTNTTNNLDGKSGNEGICCSPIAGR